MSAIIFPKLTSSDLYGEGQKRQEFGITTVVVNSRQGGCSECAKYIGKVFIDDVYSGGKASDGDYPLLSEAIAGGLFHPRCKDGTSTYYEGITELTPISPEELAAMEQQEELEAKQQYAERQAKRFDRRAKYSLDDDNKRTAQARADEWHERAEGFKKIKVSSDENIEKFAESGIIKSIDIDDFEVVTYGKDFNPKVSKIIIDTMSKCETEGGFVISEINAKSLQKTTFGTPVLQIEPLANGLLQLNLNTDVLSGKTLDEINSIFAKSKLSIVNSLREAVWHEAGHAKVIAGKNTDDIVKLYNELSKIHIKGISKIAYNDGTEAIAEIEVLRMRGSDVTKEMISFYEKYTGRKY